MKALDVAGKVFGRLTALRRVRDGSPYTRWLFRCSCGKEHTAILGNVTRGQVSSCGCAGSRVTIGERSRKHGHSVGYKKSRTAQAWRNAKTRCFNENNAKFPDYGGRGITMCREWADDFRSFLRDMGECPDGMTLERIDVNGNYEPGNCRWATTAEQARNRRNNVFVDDNGTILRVLALNEGISYQGLHRRVRKLGESPDQAVSWFKRRKSAQNKTPSRMG